MTAATLRHLFVLCLAWASPLQAESSRSAHSTHCAQSLLPATVDKDRTSALVRKAGLPPARVNTTTPYQRRFGPIVTLRNAAGHASVVTLRVLVGPSPKPVEVIGDFNQWGKFGSPVYLMPVPGTEYVEGKVTFQHGSEYRLVVGGKQVLDPASDLYTSPDLLAAMGRRTTHPHLNSIFWDYDRPGAYQLKYPRPNLKNKQLVISETNIHALVAEWPHDGQVGPSSISKTYRYVAESGVIDQLKESGVNVVELMPLTPGVDGQSWHLAYQPLGIHGLEGRYGTPDDFLKMVDAFHAAGIALILDGVFMHYPFAGNAAQRELGAIGPHNFKKPDGGNLFGGMRSEWGTNLRDFSRPATRQFMVDAAVSHVQRFGYSGIRYDYVDALRSTDGGWAFMQEVNAVLSQRQDTFFISESFGHDPGLTKNVTVGGAGMDAVVGGSVFNFIRENALLNTEQVDMEQLRHVLTWDINNGTPFRVSHMINHDEVANARGGLSGYYPPTQLDGGGWYYVQRKIIAFSSIAALTGSFYLEMPNLATLQSGSYYENPAVAWHRLDLPAVAPVTRFLADRNKAFLNNPAFAPQNLNHNMVVRADNSNKTLVLQRFDYATKRQTFVIISLNHQSLENFQVPHATGSRYLIRLDSDLPRYGGEGRLGQSGPLVTNEHAELLIPQLAPYHVLIMEESTEG